MSSNPSAIKSKKSALPVALAILVLIGCLGVGVFYLIQPETNNTDSDANRVGMVASAPNSDRALSEAASTREAVSVTSAPAGGAKAPAHPPGRGSLTIEAIFEYNNKLAPNIGILIVPFNSQDTNFDKQYVVTNALGIARCESLLPGVFVAYGDRGGNVRTTIIAGKENREKLMIQRGVDVDGSVVSPSGAPVAGADIWLSSYANNSEGRFVTMSDAGGRFTIESVLPGHLVAARAAGFAFSYEYKVRATIGSRQTIQIQLINKEAVVDGIVTDPDGNPVEGAVVRAGPEHPNQFQSQNQSGQPGSTAPPMQFTTNEKGYFSATGLEPGTVKIQVRSRGFAPWTDDVTVTDVEPAHLTIKLDRGFSLFGMVKTAAGEPAKEVPLLAYRASQGSNMGFLSYRTGTDAAGMYEFNDLPKSQVLVRTLPDAKSDGTPLGIVDGTPGGRVRKDFNISERGEIVGKVRDARGEPVVGFAVYARQIVSSVPLDTRGVDPDTAKTDSSGHFRILRCVPGVYTVYTNGTPKLTKSGSASVSPVVPGGGEIEIIINTIRERNASIRGRLLNSDGAPVEDGKIYCYGTDLMPQAKPRDGYFEFTPMSAGQYTVAAECAGLPKFTRLCEVKENEALDLGNITIPQGGRLEVSVQADASIPPLALGHSFVINPITSVSTYPPRSIFSNLENIDGLLVCPSIAPGKYNLTTSGSFAHANVPFEIESGKTTKLQMSPRNGARRHFKFKEADGAPPLVEVTATITDSGGTIVATVVTTPDSTNANLIWSISLPVGKYQIRTVASDGRKGESMFSVVRDDESMSIIDVRVR